jgi:hypothetical protein
MTRETWETLQAEHQRGRAQMLREAWKLAKERKGVEYANDIFGPQWAN